MEVTGRLRQISRLKPPAFKSHENPLKKLHESFFNLSLVYQIVMMCICFMKHFNLIDLDFIFMTSKNYLIHQRYYYKYVFMNIFSIIRKGGYMAYRRRVLEGWCLAYRKGGTKVWVNGLEKKGTQAAYKKVHALYLISQFSTGLQNARVIRKSPFSGDTFSK